TSAHARLVVMFLKGTDSDVKKSIIYNFTKPSSLRIVLCTDAFGMGIDCKDMWCIIHYCVPTDKETYVQQIRRAPENHGCKFCDNSVRN
uniref:Helicase C-terminal domain-containing protein n=1 Tax=Amphimedon queenslandica TaxID=400682 RepID=A0A1X7V9N7_AMPQE